jgi:hypothetical protein
MFFRYQTFLFHSSRKEPETRKSQIITSCNLWQRAKVPVPESPAQQQTIHMRPVLRKVEHGYSWVVGPKFTQTGQLVGHDEHATHCLAKQLQRKPSASLGQTGPKCRCQSVEDGCGSAKPSLIANVVRSKI